MNLTALPGVGLTPLAPTTHGGLPFLLEWYFEHQFNSSSLSFSEEIGKWVL